MCVSSASTGLCGGRRATAVPTATGGLQSAFCEWPQPCAGRAEALRRLMKSAPQQSCRAGLITGATATRWNCSSSGAIGRPSGRRWQKWQQHHLWAFPTALWE